MSKLHVSLVTPTAELFSGLVDHVIAPGSEGEFGVLYNHMPFMTTLVEGDVTLINDAKRTLYHVRGGFADVTSEGMTILAEYAEII
jgi:F-type H+-transporting ATPase subunit epsilon